jgi:ABC-type amino acid transport substrate-binding protein
MLRRRTLASLLSSGFPVLAPSLARAQSEADRELASGGRLRVLAFLNPPVLRRRADGTFEGVTVDVAGFVAGRLGATIEIETRPSPAALIAALAGDDWDLAFGPRTLAPQSARWAGDLVLLDNQVIAAPGVEIDSMQALDRPGQRLAVVAGGGSERRLGEILRHTVLVQMPDVATAVAALAQRQVDAYAGNGESVARVAETVAGTRIVPGSIFFSVHFAAAIPLARSTGALARAEALLAEARQAGLVTRAIQRDSLRGVRPAP